MDKLAGLFSAHSEPPVPPEQAGVPVPEHRGTTGVSDHAPTAAASDEIHGGTATDEQPKKRGFWSKVFGKKDKGDDDKKKEDKKKSDQLSESSRYLPAQLRMIRFGQLPPCRSETSKGTHTSTNCWHEPLPASRCPPA